MRTRRGRPVPRDALLPAPPTRRPRAPLTQERVRGRPGSADVTAACAASLAGLTSPLRPRAHARSLGPSTWPASCIQGKRGVRAIPEGPWLRRGGVQGAGEGVSHLGSGLGRWSETQLLQRLPNPRGRVCHSSLQGPDRLCSRAPASQHPGRRSPLCAIAVRDTRGISPSTLGMMPLECVQKEVLLTSWVRPVCSPTSPGPLDPYGGPTYVIGSSYSFIGLRSSPHSRVACE